jgi:chromosome segregation ATPase
LEANMKSVAFTTFAVFTLLHPLPTRAQDTGQLGPNNPALMAAREEVDKADRELADREKQLEIQQHELSSASGLVAATPEAIRQLADRLQTEKEAIEVELAGTKGREDAITKAIAQTSERVKARSDADEVTRQIESVVALRQKQLDRLRQLQATGAVPNAEVEAAEANVATARAELAAAKQKTSAPSADLLEALNRELINLTITRQEHGAKLEFINNRLKQLAPALNISRNVEKATRELARAERHRDAAIEQLTMVQRPPRNPQ